MREHMSSQELIALEDQYGAHNYHPLPVVIGRAEGIYVYDVEGRQYMDFLAAYSAVNQGHRHPKIINALVEQAQLVTLTSRAFYNDRLGPAEKLLCDTFGYQKALLMNSGAEAVETAIKLARRWAYDKKGVAKDQALIVTAKDNFHGRTSTVVSFSTDPESYGGFGPRTPGFMNVPFNDIASLQTVLQEHKDRVAAFLVEPIQGEAGVIVPDDGYLEAAHKLCLENNCLLICDEIQAGLGRTGRLLACHHDNVRPEIVLMGKALSGGVLPVSAVLADDDVMLCFKPGQHGSTFGGNPLACAVLVAALDALIGEKMIESAAKLGVKFLSDLQKIRATYPTVVRAVRGKGLMMAMEINAAECRVTAWEICLALKGKGILVKPTHEHILRLTPPLVITEAELETACRMIESTIAEIAAQTDCKTKE